MYSEAILNGAGRSAARGLSCSILSAAGISILLSATETCNYLPRQPSLVKRDSDIGLN